MKLAIIIPAYKEIPQLKKCLAALALSINKHFDTIVIDHAANEEISEWVRRVHPGVIILRGSPEIWWTGATNVGVEYSLKSKYTHIMLLNHDCYVRPNTIGNLVNHVKENPDSIIAPAQHRLQDRKNVYQVSSLFLLGFSTVIWPFFKNPIGKIGRELLPTSMILGGRGVLISKNVFQYVGLFDETLFPHYGADHDFYLRCKSAGLQLYVSTQAIVDVDNTRAVGNNEIGRLSMGEFLSTFFHRSSHRNIRDLLVLFKKHYPLPGLYPIGVILNLVRYCLIYLISRGRFLISRVTC